MEAGTWTIIIGIAALLLERIVKHSHNVYSSSCWGKELIKLEKKNSEESSD